ncbi:hypothetical protein Vafri_5354, partial [Volvox africanus]
MARVKASGAERAEEGDDDDEEVGETRDGRDAAKGKDEAAALREHVVAERTAERAAAAAATAAVAAAVAQFGGPAAQLSALQAARRAADIATEEQEDQRRHQRHQRKPSGSRRPASGVPPPEGVAIPTAATATGGDGDGQTAAVMVHDGGGDSGDGGAHGVEGLVRKGEHALSGYSHHHHNNNSHQPSDGCTDEQNVTLQLPILWAADARANSQGTSEDYDGGGRGGGGDTVQPAHVAAAGDTELLHAETADSRGGGGGFFRGLLSVTPFGRMRGDSVGGGAEASAPYAGTAERCSDTGGGKG